MNARIASVEIRYPRSEFTGLKDRAFRPLALSIQTENLQMELIQAAQTGISLPGVYQAVDETAAGWMWALFTHRGDPVGFLALNSSASSPEGDGHFGPQLDIACRRDAAHAPYVPEAIAALLGWLRRHDICFVIYADHARSDAKLAQWLIGTGFLYTGCHRQDGHLQMICLL
jgi:hypothetical protein